VSEDNVVSESIDERLISAAVRSRFDEADARLRSLMSGPAFMIAPPRITAA
jgi:hypothetical protein